MTKEIKDRIKEEVCRDISVDKIVENISNIIDEVVGNALSECGEMGEIMRTVGLKIVSID